MKPIRSATVVETNARGLLLDCGADTTCMVSVLEADLVRVRFTRNGLRAPTTWMVPAMGASDVPWEGRDRLDESSWPAVPFTIENRDGAVCIATGALTLTVKLSPFALTWALPDGRAFAADRPAHAYSLGGARRTMRHAQARHDDDRYYGLGDKTGPMNLAGRRLRTTMMDSLGFDPEHGDPLYKHWPFLITQDGATGTAYGALYDNMAAATFDLGCEHDNYYGPYRTYEADDGDLDYYLFVGPRILDVTRRFLDLTGRPALPPRWTLGYAQTAMAIADSDNAQERIEQFIERCASERIPVSAFHFGSGYTSIGPRRYVFNWNRGKFPDPERLMQHFHDAGMHIVANLKPCLLDDHPRYAEPLAAGAFVQGDDGPAVSQFWDGEGAHLDFTNPAGIEWWQRGLREQVLATGIDVAWNDNNEYGFWNEDAVCAGFGTAMPLDLARPVQPLLMTRASLDEQRRHWPDERQFTVTRAGCPGIQRYAQTWSGDNATSWESLKWNLRTGLGMSLSGMVNTGHDVGGFSGPVPGPELLIRWTQMGSLHPRFIMNSWKPDGVYTSPWLHPEATPLIRDAIRLRYRLIPYLYSLMHDATERGIPPLRPPFAVFDGHRSEQDDFMVGPSLLACPVVTEGATEVVATLPSGPECWFDFWTETRHEAGRSVRIAAPLDRLPLLCPAGAILAMTDAPDDFARLHDEPSRCVRLFPGPGTGSSRFVLTEDDGISADGPVSRVLFEMSWTLATVHLAVVVEGGYRLPYDRIAVCLPRADLRRLTLASSPDAPALTTGSFRATGLR